MFDVVFWSTLGSSASLSAYFGYKGAEKFGKKINASKNVTNVIKFTSIPVFGFFGYVVGISGIVCCTLLFLPMWWKTQDRHRQQMKNKY